jgi:hypothetical protein
MAKFQKKACFIFFGSVFTLFAGPQNQSLVGEWLATKTTFGVRPIMRYYANCTYEAALITKSGKEHPVSRGTYSITGNTITEITTSVEKNYFGFMSRIKAGETIIHVSILPDGMIRSEDNPFGGKVLFKRSSTVKGDRQ